MTRRKKDFNKFLEKTSKKYGWSKKLTLEVAQQAFMRYLSDEELLITYDKIKLQKKLNKRYPTQRETNEFE